MAKTETNIITVYTQSQSSGKTFFTINFVAALARAGYSVALVDDDGSNAKGAGTSSSILGLRPRRNRGFWWGRTVDFQKDKASQSRNFIVMDSGRKPSHDAEDTARDSSLVIIPVRIDPAEDPTVKSLNDGAAAHLDFAKAGIKTAILPILRNGGKIQTLQSKFEPYKDFHTVNYLPPMYEETLAAHLLQSGDLLSDCVPGDEAEAEAAESRFDVITAKVLQFIGEKQAGLKVVAANG